MPCYDPPPPWEGDQKKNANLAAQLLCAHAKQFALRDMPDDLLEWFLGHRRIDLQQLLTPYYGKQGTPEEVFALSNELMEIQAELDRRGKS